MDTSTSNPGTSTACTSLVHLCSTLLAFLAELFASVVCSPSVEWRREIHTRVCGDDDDDNDDGDGDGLSLILNSI